MSGMMCLAARLVEKLLSPLCRYRIMVQKQSYPTIINLQELAKVGLALEMSWCKETSGVQEMWTKVKIPSLGQCAVTALILQDHFGGELMKTEVKMPKEFKGWPHYLILLPVLGRHDLTVKQFGDVVDFEPLKPIRREDLLRSSSDIGQRYELLKRNVDALLRQQE